MDHESLGHAPCSLETVALGAAQAPAAHAGLLHSWAALRAALHCVATAVHCMAAALHRRRCCCLRHRTEHRMASAQAEAAAGRATVTAVGELARAGLAPVLLMLPAVASVALMAAVVSGDCTDPEIGYVILAAHGVAVAGLLVAVCVCASYRIYPTPHPHAPYSPSRVAHDPVRIIQSSEKALKV